MKKNPYKPFRTEIWNIINKFDDESDLSPQEVVILLVNWH